MCRTRSHQSPGETKTAVLKIGNIYHETSPLQSWALEYPRFFYEHLQARRDTVLDVRLIQGEI